MRIRKKIRPPKTRSAVPVDASTIIAEYDFKYAKIVFDARMAYIEVKPEEVVFKHGESILIAVEEFDRFRVRNAIGCINDPFNREELMKSEEAETVRRLVSNAYLELNERSFSIMDSAVSLARGVESGFIFYNWMPSSWVPSSTEFLEYPGLRSLYKTKRILTKKKGRHSRGRCGYQGRKPR